MSAPRRSIDEVLERSRRGIVRPGPSEAHAAAAGGALLVDIRPSELRSRDGEIEGAAVIDRNVLEWRLDPASPHRLDGVDDTTYNRDLIVVCDEGYASSLAAASLRDLGLRLATDLAGGFQAWVSAGLPVVRGSGRR